MVAFPAGRSAASHFIGPGLRALAAVALLGAVGLAGCADSLRGPASTGGSGPYGYAPPPPPPPPPALGFDPADFAWSKGVGPGALSGRVAYQAASGERWTCQGQPVALVPSTRYSARRMMTLYGSLQSAVTPKSVVQARNAAEPGVDYGAFVRTSACSAHDGFAFPHLPTGVYFLIAGAHPKGAPAGPDGGVVILQRVDVAPGPTRIVVPAPA